MGIDYSGVCGIGVKVNDEIVDKFIENNIFDRGDWEDDPDYCLEKANFIYGAAGSYYSGEVCYYLFVDGANLAGINKNAPAFVDSLSKLGISIDVDDLIMIEDILVS
jgi:hypothetical protein